MKQLLSVITFLLLLAMVGKSQQIHHVDRFLTRAASRGNVNTGNQNFEVDLPTGWTTTDTVFDNIYFFYLVAPKQDDNDKTNIGIISEAMQNMSLKQYCNQSIRTLKMTSHHLHILERGDITAGNVKGAWFTYTATRDDGSIYFMITYLIPINGISYTIGATTEPQYVDKLRSTFDAVAASFRLKD